MGASDQAENKQQRRSSMAIVEIRLQGSLEEQTKNTVKTVTPRTIKTSPATKPSNILSQSTPFVQSRPKKTTKSLLTPVQKVITVNRPTASTLNPTVSSQHYVLLNKQSPKKQSQNRSPVIQQPEPTQPTLHRVHILNIFIRIWSRFDI